MKNIEYLSPSAIGTWISDRDEFYLRYLSDNRPPRSPQTRPMAVGSAFDAYVKAALHANLGGADPAYSFEALFEAQVEEQHRDWARENGGHVFHSYCDLGAYDSILSQLLLSDTPPRFEFELRGTITHRGRSIVFLGRPDLVYVIEGNHIILDWKVNGYLAKYATSPLPGFTMLRGGPSGGKPHRSCVLEEVHGILINSREGLEAVDTGWARQLSIYAWLLGAEVGSGFICGIDQIVCKPATPYPVIRVAEHRYRVGGIFQTLLFKLAAGIHDAIARDHIFEDLSFSDDKLRRETLDRVDGAFDTSNDRDRLFLEMTRS